MRESDKGLGLDEVLGEARDIETLCNCRVMLDAGGYKEAEILYAKDRVWTKFLLSTNVWSGQYIPFDRRPESCWVPFQLRDNNTFDKVGEIFGIIICPSEFTWSNVDISSGVCYVLTTSGARIVEEVNLIWKNESHSI
ncbi:hypothetical protein L1987_30032 [Smallanthus sonchifolius]|uniref:Uncharacterized protein n=1 Tax=Smallanthus sonchifolius TaxID=185202 RepID=A0ACB9I1P8_9ASTR|nr:hypothetical protein L1987_30032 [Smallanthus sonchifolius]